jgi:LPXTG-motif cell wall-anchored protein
VVPKQGENEMNAKAVWTRARLVLAAGAVALAFALAFALSMSAQVQTTTNTTAQKSTVATQVESGEVVTVSGNDLVVKMADGSIRHFANVSESARATVDGQQLGIHDLKPGMKLQRTITTTTTPKTITTVQSVTGTVWNVMPPTSVILTLEDGKNQQFKIPKNQKFNVDGQMVDAWGLKKGMKISATKVVEVPETVVAQQRKITGTMPPPPPPPPADVPILVVVEEVVVPVEVAQAAPAELPKTGSQLPLIGLLGLLSLATSLGLRTARKSC